ncbi:MAG: restriction endonuclease subunit S [Ignavibacteriaceae bacterium]|nr:restriction endonuclease subunit S [Ignavibacteriaceae bacterium]
MKGKFGDYVEIILGGTPKTNTPSFWNGNIPWVSVKDLNDFKKIYNTERFITEAGLRNSNTKLLEIGDIILSARGSVGKIGVVAVPMAFNQTSYALRSKNISLFDQNFLYYFTKSLVNILQSKAVGGVFDTIIKSTIAELEISLPPLETQKKIASILSSYDDLIENNLNRIKLLEEAASNIYKEWFINFRFPGYEKTKFVNGIPEGWERVRLKDVATIVMGQSPESQYYNQNSTGLPFHQGVSYFSERYIIDDVFCSKETRIALAGDILVSVRAPVGRINLTLNKIIIGRGLCSIRSANGCNLFLYYCLRKIFYKEDLIGNGSIFNSIKKTDIENIILLYPQNILEVLFNHHSLSLENKIINLITQNRKLQQARDILLPKLMSGEIEV